MQNLKSRSIRVHASILPSIVVISCIISPIIKILLCVVVTPFILILLILIIDIFFHSLAFILDVLLTKGTGLVIVARDFVVKVSQAIRLGELELLAGLGRRYATGCGGRGVERGPELFGEEFEDCKSSVNWSCKIANLNAYHKVLYQAWGSYGAALYTSCYR